MATGARPICRRCSARISASASFCPRCGTKQSGTSPDDLLELQRRRARAEAEKAELQAAKLRDEHAERERARTQQQRKLAEATDDLRLQAYGIGWIAAIAGIGATLALVATAAGYAVFPLAVIFGLAALMCILSRAKTLDKLEQLRARGEPAEEPRGRR